MQKQIKKIVVIGGGFAGVNFVKNIWKDPLYHVTLVDQDNYHFFPPLLYQVATAFIEPSNISYPFRRMFEAKNNLRYHYGKFIKVNPTQNNIETDSGMLDYDYLLIAIGTETNYFGMENVKKYSMPMKSIDNAINLRNHLLLNMEKAVIANDKAEKEKLLNIVISGGGPSVLKSRECLQRWAIISLPKNIRKYPELIPGFIW